MSNKPPVSDERIIEYDVDKVLFESESPFQKVQIVHTKSVGNMLVLDELQSEFDFSSSKCAFANSYFALNFV